VEGGREGGREGGAEFKMVYVAGHQKVTKKGWWEGGREGRREDLVEWAYLRVV
jgi:hypothetical protein